MNKNVIAGDCMWIGTDYLSLISGKWLIYVTMITVLALLNAGCTNDKTRAMTDLGVRIEPIEKGLAVHVKNISKIDKVVINQLDPAFEVLALNITDRNGTIWPVFWATDWLLKDDDVVVLQPGQEITHELLISDFRHLYKLASGSYRIRAEYKIDPDAFYIVQWRDGADSNDQRHHKLVESLWYGSVQSNEISLTIEDE